MCWVILTAMACRNQNVSKNIDCKIFEKLHSEDQHYRTDPKVHPLLYVCDSLFYMDHGYRVNYNDMPSEYDKRASVIIKNRDASDFINLAYSDSIQNIMIINDKRLTLELMDHMKNYSHDELYNSKCFKKALSIFVHTPNEYMPMVNNFLNIHRNAIPDPTYNHILRTYFNYGYNEVVSINRSLP